MPKIVDWFWKNVVEVNDMKRIAAQPVPENVEMHVDIAYVDDGNKYHQYDIYRPEGNNEKLPVIFDIHGGGWYYGDKELNSYFCRALTKYGFAVVNNSYRLVPETDIFGQVQDVFKSMEHVKSIADKFNLDLDNFFVVGDSAGGHLAGLVANIVKSKELQEKFNVTPSIDVKAVGMICPAADPINMIGEQLNGLMKFYFNPVFGKGYLKNGIGKLVSFMDNLQKDVCPCFFISCNGDFLAKQTKAAYELVKANGTDTELFFLEESIVEDHKLEHVFNVLHWEWEEAQMANEKMCDFFKKYVK